MNIYVASSWRNAKQPNVVGVLRHFGHDVYDFKNPEPGVTGFSWIEIDKHWESWSPAAFRRALEHPVAVDGFDRDYAAMMKAEVCVLVMPCGRSAHIEAGYFVGARKPLIIFVPDDSEPELMYLMADYICTTLDEVTVALSIVRAKHIPVIEDPETAA